MKFRTMLLASAAVMFATSASAADITAKFFTPAQGGILSDTSIESSRTKLDLGEAFGGEEVFKSLVASEEVTYGVTDNFAVFGSIANAFNVDKDYNNNHNFAYEIGGKYTTSYDKFLGQVSFAYNTWDPRSWYGKGAEGVPGGYETNRWAKSLSAEVAAGYAFDCGLTPYTSFSIDGDIDRADRDQTYSWFIGAHKMFDKVSVDAGVRYDFGNEEGYKAEQWHAEAEANYFIKENLTVGIFGDYYLGGTWHHDVDYDYTAGINAKVLF